MAQEETKTKVPTFSQIIKNNPSGYILRSDLTEKTGGLLHSRTQANLDSLGIGIPGRIKIGNRKVAYPVQAVVEYLQKLVELADGK
ncbi:MAG: hypothetical protein HUN04_02730 [Desulfobacter sp.]|nr:MAG: hypothetical protein HUN04_02730 [Desulfobacter sp.]